LDENKKPGARDISDLKARLGLKKTGVMPTAAPQGPAATTPQGQPAAGGLPTPVAPQPAAGARAPIPSPFGQPEPAAPAPAAPPDPRRDPFAQAQAANLAAFYGVGQVLPGSAEGVAAEPLSQPKPWGRIGFVVGLSVVVFGLGNACGRIYNSRVEFNRSIDDSAKIRVEVDKLNKNLNNIVDTLRESKPVNGFDIPLAERLGSLDLTKPDTQKIFHTNYYHLEDVAIERLFQYYNDTIILYDLIQQHAKRTDADKDAITKYAANAAAKGAEKNYGIILDMSKQFPIAHLAELGQIVCPKEGETNCAPAEAKFKYRTDSGGAWGERPVKGKPDQTVTPIEKTPLFGSVMAGNPDLLAAKDYVRRMAAIAGLSQKLAAAQKDVIGDLKRSTDRPKVFVF
jgi:hypothetical protein